MGKNDKRGPGGTRLGMVMLPSLRMGKSKSLTLKTHSGSSSGGRKKWKTGNVIIPLKEDYPGGGGLSGENEKWGTAHAGPTVLEGGSPCVLCLGTAGVEKYPQRKILSCSRIWTSLFVFKKRFGVPSEKKNPRQRATEKPPGLGQAEFAQKSKGLVGDISNVWSRKCAGECNQEGKKSRWAKAAARARVEKSIC